MDRGDIARHAVPALMAERRGRQQFNPDIVRRHVSECQAELRVITHIKPVLNAPSVPPAPSVGLTVAGPAHKVLRLRARAALPEKSC